MYIMPSMVYYIHISHYEGDIMECEIHDCDAKATHVSTVSTVNYRESSYFCTEHKDSGYRKGKPIPAGEFA